MKKLKFQGYNIDKKMLPVKLHYLFYPLAMAPIYNYIPLIAKNIGITATGLGVMYTIIPIGVILISPLFGCITDKYKKIKFIIMFLIMLHTPVYFSIIYIPKISKEKYVLNDVKLHCNESYSANLIESSKLLIKIPNNTTLECMAECPNYRKTFDLISQSILNNSRISPIANISLKDNSTYAICPQHWNDNCNINCSFEKSEEINSFLHYQFWLFVTLSSIGIMLFDVIIALSDAACYESLEDRVNQFGKQRLWMSFGWGVSSLTIGYVIDYVNTNNNGKTDFSIIIYVMLPLILCDMIILKFTNMKKEKSSSNILRDVRKIFVKPHPFFFITTVFLIGTLLGLMWNYSYWYLEELGGSKTLMGISTAILCFCADIPFMFISGWIIKRIGRDNSMCLAFITLSVWFLNASYIYNPWLILLPYAIQGPSFGLFYTAMTSYGKLVAVAGTEATMQTIMGAAFNGLGLGLGCLVGGIGFDKYGIRLTYRFVGYFALGTAVVYKLLTKFIAGEDSMIKDKKEVDMENPKIEDSSQ